MNRRNLFAGSLRMGKIYLYACVVTRRTAARIIADLVARVDRGTPARQLFPVPVPSRAVGRLRNGLKETTPITINGPVNGTLMDASTGDATAGSATLLTLCIVVRCDLGFPLSNSHRCYCIA